MLGEIFSVTNLVSVAFLAYMGNSVFTLGKFWFPETCPEDADFDGKIGCSNKVEYVFLMVSILSHAESGPQGRRTPL